MIAQDKDKSFLAIEDVQVKMFMLRYDALFYNSPILHSTARNRASLYCLPMNGVIPSSNGGILSSHCLILYCYNYEIRKEFQVLSKCPPPKVL